MVASKKKKEYYEIKIGCMDLRRGLGRVEFSTPSLYHPFECEFSGFWNWWSVGLGLELNQTPFFCDLAGFCMAGRMNGHPRPKEGQESPKNEPFYHGQNTPSGEPKKIKISKKRKKYLDCVEKELILAM